MTDHESISKTEDVQRPTPGVDLEANRVSSDYLSCEIPEGWVATANDPTSSHPFTICPEGASDEDGVEVICVRLPPFPDEFHKVGTPDLRLTLMKSTLFTLDRTPFLPRPLDYHTVEAHGCTCAITQVVVRDNPGFEFYIHQDGPQREFLRVTFYSWENDRLKEAQALVEELAKSVRVYENETPECVRAFQECLDTKVEPERFEQLANQYVSPLNATRMTAYTMAAYIVEAYNTDNLSSRKRMKLGLEEFASFNKSLEPSFEQLADAADAQTHYFEEGSEQLASIRETVASIFNQLPITPDNLGDARLPAEDTNKLLTIATTYLSDPSKTVQTAIDKTLAPSERMRALLSRVGIAPSEGEENEEPNPEPAKSRDVDVPTLVMSLLSDGYVSFEDSDIPRKKGHHAIAGVGVSEQKREDLALIAQENGFDDANELIDYFVSALQEVEKDEAFFVPKKTGINKGLYRIVRKGDLTGITFANMANYTDSFRIKSEGPDAYQVEYSEPVAIGLPRFFGMVCRLIWDLRQCENAQRGIPFSVRFSRIGIEFNRIGRMSVWWEYPKVTFVDGAQDDPALVNVTSAPSTDLTEGIEIVGEQPAGAAAEADSMDLPATMLALLSNGYVSFGEKDLSWSKGDHVIRGLQIGSPVHPRLATLARVNGFKNTDDLLEHFMTFMGEVEKDEALVVPRASISKALHPIVRRGDLTGITLVNLTASEAFRIINDSPNSYTVMHDDALADGIPHFFELMCRLLWDLRQCVETLKDAPFQVTFTSYRNLDLSQLLRGSIPRVDGAQGNPGTVSVSEAPKIDLGSASASEGKAKSTGKGATRKSKPKPAATPKSVPVAATKPEPKPKPESKPEPKPEPTTKPEPAESHNVNSMLLLTLLADDYVFFQDTDIAWERGHHVIRGMRANLPKIEELNAIVRENGFDSFAELCDRLVSFLLEVEKDKALVVPRDRVSKALYPIIFDGDLTGITLANLAANMAAFRVLNDRPNNYTVTYDGTLADGIPHFFDLMCRLLWDLRLCMPSLKGVPFQVTFARCRNLDLSQLLKGNVSRVDGAQDNPFSVTVSEEPAIGLEAVASEEPVVGIEAVASEEPPAKAPSDLTSKCERLETVLDLLLAASTEHHRASRALFANEESAAEDKEELRRIADYKNHLEEQLGSAKEEKLRLEKKLAKLLVRKSDLQGERDQLSTEINQLEEKLRELEADRKSLPFYAIFKSSQLSSKIAELADQKNEHLDRIRAIDEKLSAITGADIEKQIQDQERKIASLPEEIEAQPQKEDECKSRLEKTKKDHRNLAFKATRATKQMVEALGRYNDYVDSLSFTNTERRSDEYRSLRGHVTSLTSQLKEQGITAADRRAFPKLKSPMR